MIIPFKDQWIGVFRFRTGLSSFDLPSLLAWGDSDVVETA
jgi:hypothetical protein